MLSLFDYQLGIDLSSLCFVTYQNVYLPDSIKLKCVKEFTDTIRKFNHQLNCWKFFCFYFYEI